MKQKSTTKVQTTLHKYPLPRHGVPPTTFTGMAKCVWPPILLIEKHLKWRDFRENIQCYTGNECCPQRRVPKIIKIMKSQCTTESRCLWRESYAWLPPSLQFNNIRFRMSWAVELFRVPMFSYWTYLHGSDNMSGPYYTSSKKNIYSNSG